MKQCLVWLFLCLAKCGCRNKIQRKFAFFPPQPPTYTLRLEQDISVIKPSTLVKSHTQNLSSPQLRIHRISSEITAKDTRPYKTDIPLVEDIPNFGLPTYVREEFHRPDQKLHPQQELKLIDLKGNPVEICSIEDLIVTSYFTQTRTQNTIPLVLIQPQIISDYVIIYSHPNSTDLGLMLDNFLDLAYNLKINVIGYDYTGYGQSSGQPSDLNAIADIEAIYEFAVKQLGFKWNKIILYGQSIGSGPSVTLASNHLFPVAGLIIHAGLASGLKVFNPKLKKLHYYDIFPNEEYLRYVNCLVYIFHGTDDQQIAVKSAESVSKNVRNLYCVWYIEEAGHNNIEFENRQEKIRHLTLCKGFAQSTFKNYEDFYEKYTREINSTKNQNY